LEGRAGSLVWKNVLRYGLSKRGSLGSPEETLKKGQDHTRGDFVVEREKKPAFFF